MVYDLEEGELKKLEVDVEKYKVSIEIQNVRRAVFCSTVDVSV